MEVRLNHDIDGNFYGSYLIPLSAALESSLLDLCEYVRDRESLPLKATDLREQGTVKRAFLYLQLGLRRPITGVETIPSALRDLQNVRNVLAHANGRIDELQEGRKQELEALAKAGQWIRVWDKRVIVLPPFLLRSTEAAEQLVNQCLDLLAVAYPNARK